MAEDLIGTYLEGIEAVRASAAETRAQVEAFLSPDREQAILQAALATPEGQKLYTNVYDAMHPGSVEPNLAKAAQIVGAVASSTQPVPILPPEVIDKVTHVAETLGTAGDPFNGNPCPAVSGWDSGKWPNPNSTGNPSSSGTTSSSSASSGSSARIPTSVPTFEAPKKPAQETGAVGTPSPAQSGSGTGTTTAKTDSSGVGGYGFKTNSPSEAESYQTNSSMLAYIRNKSNPKLTADNVTDADQMVISELAYVTKSVPDSSKPYDSKSDGPKTVGEYCKELLAKKQYAMEHDPNYKADAAEYQFLQEMANSPRYKDLPIDCVTPYHNGRTDTNVISVNIGDNKSIIGIQGTNGTVEDWINDAQFAYSDPTEEERYLTGELDRIVSEYGYDGVYVTGHSQGGRDAITASAFCSDETRSRIIRVTNLDGPGYSKEFLEKYGDRIEVIEGRIRNIYPSGSYVGQLLNPVGDSNFTESLGENFDPYLHAQYNWVIDPETGELVPADVTSPKYVLGQVINFATDYISEALSPEQINQAGNIIFRLMYDDDDPTSMDFKNIANHLDELSFGDIEILIESALTVTAKAVGDLAEKIEEICEVLTDVLLVIAVVCLPFAPEVSAAILEIIEVIDKIAKYAKIVKYVCKGIVWVMQKIAEWRAARLAKEKADYVSSHPELKFISEALTRAAEHLIAANNAIKQADADCDGIRRGFRKGTYDEEGGFLGWIYNVFSTVKAALSWLGAGAIDLIWLKNQPLLTKGSSVCNKVSAEGLKILSSVPYAGSDGQFYVIPNALSNAAETGAESAKNSKKKTEEAKDAITKLGSAWQGEDYDSFKVKSEESIQKLDESIESMEKSINLLSSVAGIYSKYQEACIEAFQYAVQ